jgi:hypothetical protein
MNSFREVAMKTMILVAGMLIALGGSAAIVNNSTSLPTAEDSIATVFYSLDSLGNPTTADSLFVTVSGPSGGFVFSDSMLVSDGRVSTSTIGSARFYQFCDQVSNIDGGGDPGGYSLGLVARNNSLGLLTPTHLEFQIVTRGFSDQLQMIEDSVLVRGGAIDTNFTERGPDSSLIAGWVWNTPQSGHTTAGTFGKYLDSEISGIASGSGLYSYTLRLYDTVSEQVVPGARVVVRNLPQTALIAVGTSDGLGAVTFNLDADSFMVMASSPGYIFETYDTLVVSGAGVDTIRCAGFDPGAPAFPTFCRVWGYLFNATGGAEDDVDVSAHLPSGVTSISSGIVTPTAVSVATDSSGYFFLDLLPSSLLGSAGAEYEFTISRQDGTILRQRLEVPDSTSWKLRW